MTRAKTMLLLTRFCLTLLTITIGILVFGPYGGDEAYFGLTDKEAHVLAFYSLSVMGLLAMPRLRKWDVALICCAAGGLVEVIQTFVGRDGDILDWLADSAGIILAVAPMSFQSFRMWVRTGQTSGHKRRKSDRRSAPDLSPNPARTDFQKRA